MKSDGVADERLKMFLCVLECHNDKVGGCITNVNQLFETEAAGFNFTFQSNPDSEVEIGEQAKDNDQSNEDSATSFYVPSFEPTPPPSPWTSPYSTLPPPQSELDPSPEPKKSRKRLLRQ